MACKGSGVSTPKVSHATFDAKDYQSLFLKWNRHSWRGIKARRTLFFSVLLIQPTKNPDLTTWTWLLWWQLCSPTLHGVLYGPWGSPTEILAMMKSEFYPHLWQTSPCDLEELSYHCVPPFPQRTQSLPIWQRCHEDKLLVPGDHKLWRW